jgi:hypothetical protein
MIELEAQFDGALRPLKPRPIKDLRTEFDEAAIQRPQRVFEPKAPTLRGSQNLTAVEQVIEDGLVQLPRSVCIGVRQGGAGGCPLHAYS